jgi:hypothetical protein
MPVAAVDLLTQAERGVPGGKRQGLGVPVRGRRRGRGGGVRRKGGTSKTSGEAPGTLAGHSPARIGSYPQATAVKRRA